MITRLLLILAFAGSAFCQSLPFIAAADKQGHPATAADTFDIGDLVATKIFLEADSGVYKDNLATLSSANGDSTYIWLDQSGNANHANQAATAGFRPIFTNSCINGLPGMIFDGTDDILVLTNTFATALRNVSKGHILAVVRSSVTDGTYRTFFSASSGSVSTSARASAYHSSGKPSAGGRRLDANSWQAKEAGHTVTFAYLHHSIFDWGNATLTVKTNAVEMVSGAFQTAGNTSDTSSLSASIGNTVAVNEQWKGWVAALAITTSDADATAITTHWRSKYGL